MFSKTFDLFLTYIVIRCSLFQMKITASISKSLHQHCGPCYLHLPIFSFTYTLLICGKIKSCCDHCFPQQSRPQNTVQLYILHVRICFNMNNKYHSLPILYIHHVSLNMQVFVIVLLRVLLIIVLLRVKGSMW